MRSCDHGISPAARDESSTGPRAKPEPRSGFAHDDTKAVQATSPGTNAVRFSPDIASGEAEILDTMLNLALLPRRSLNAPLW
jgi:hypothetical protein